MQDAVTIYTKLNEKHRKYVPSKKFKKFWIETG